MKLNHLALVVRDQDRSRRFYERYFGFDAGPSKVYDDGVLFIRNVELFDLALGVGEPSEFLPDFLHFGFTAGSADEVWSLLRRVRDDGVTVIETVEEPGFASFKCLDPDGYRVEVAWEEPEA